MSTSLSVSKFAVGIAALLVSTPAFADPPPTLERPPLVLALGEQRLLRVPGLERYSLGSDAIRALRRDFRNAPEELLIKGVRPGGSDLWVWKQDGSAEHRTIRVEKSELPAAESPLARALSRLDEAEIIHSGAGIVLRGRISSLTESARIAALAQAFPKEVLDETELDPTLLEKGRERIASWIGGTAHAKRLSVEIRNGALFVSGAIEKASEQASLRKALLALFPAAQLRLDALPDDAPTIHFKVFLLELKKSVFRTLGLAWPGSQAAAFRVTTTAIQDLLQLDLTLQALEGEGNARILSNPELVVRAPGEAELFSGGELPISQRGLHYQNVSWRSFGLTLRLKVAQSTAERVRLDIQTEVSHLDPEIASEDRIPGIQSNRMKTQVDARFGVPLLLSGLLQQNARNQARGLPWLRQIPVLGPLFGSEDFLDQKSELVAILLPNAEPPHAPPLPSAERLSGIPKGPLPPPRDFLTPSEEKRLRAERSYPWNVFE